MYRLNNRSLMSPESDMKADVYSYGMMIWEILERKIVWQDLKFEEIEKSVVHGKRPDVSYSLMDNKNERVRIMLDIMKNCWNGDERDRPT